MAVVVKGGFAGPGAGGVNGTGQQGVWRREITCTEVGHIIISEDVINDDDNIHRCEKDRKV